MASGHQWFWMPLVNAYHMPNKLHQVMNIQRANVKYRAWVKGTFYGAFLNMTMSVPICGTEQ